MRYVKAVLFLTLAVAGILFGVSNQDSATVHFYWFFTKTYPLYLVLFGCFLAGTLMAILFGFVSGGPGSDEVRRLSKRRDELTERLKKAHSTGVSLSNPGKTDGPSRKTL
ncbi:MAG TPA: LapA family protein [Deltaproteobacteria bacterium]|nr:LapA family protein [Deltaproteobacteria bacterium]HPR55270.1 LapA family protein [Deltaproteobacteria bacterium]HXK46907.1 LapA family protein [Deltaproteobacteria bacterium]